MSNITLNKANIAPKGVWVKAHFYKDGPHHLAAAVYLVANGETEVFHVRVDLRRFVKWIAQIHQQLHGNSPVVGGFPGSIGKFVAKVGKSAVVKAVAKGVKDVVRSKVTGAAIAATAVAFPAVGVPAAAAYAAANAGLDALDKAQAAKTEVKKLLASGNKTKAVALAKAAAPIVKKADKVKLTFKAMSAKAKAGNLEAKKGARIINIVAQTRNKIAKKKAQAPSAVRKAIPSKGIPGMVVSSKGKVGKGYFKKLSPKKGQLANALLVAAAKGKLKGAIQRGLFQRVGCNCVGADLAFGYRDDRDHEHGHSLGIGADLAFGYREDREHGHGHSLGSESDGIIEAIFNADVADDYMQVGCGQPNPHNPFSQVGCYR